MSSQRLQVRWWLFLKHILFHFIAGSLTDAHVLELSKRITSEEELMDLGIKVLGLPEFVIKTALFDNREKLQAATHELLSRWLKQQNNRLEAYMNLQVGLRKCRMNQLAMELKQWVEGTTADIALTAEEREF